MQVTLTVFASDLDLDLMTLRAEVAPSTAVRRGDLRKQRGDLYRHSQWQWRSDDVDNEHVGQQITTASLIAERLTEDIAQAAAIGGSTIVTLAGSVRVRTMLSPADEARERVMSGEDQVFPYVLCERLVIEIGPESLSRLGMAGVTFVAEISAGDQDWTPWYAATAN